MSENEDPYWKLRPELATPSDELCACPGSVPVMLQPRLSSNPLSCIACNREVPPERIGFPETLSEKLAFWRSFHDCFFRLWLDSGEFESWARAQLEDPKSPVNRRAFKLVGELNNYRRAYYWWFVDVQKPDLDSLAQCPACEGELSEQYGRSACEPCSIVVDF